MAKPILDEMLWKMIEPVLPKSPPSAAGVPMGRMPLPDRQVLTGILFVLKTGIPWEYLPQEMGCGSGMSCWRRLRDWQRAGVWRKLHRILLDRLNAADKIDWSRAVVDTTSVRAMHGGKKRGKAPWTAAKRAPSTDCWLMEPAGCR
jgi:transposase